jgi:amino acid transporter
MPDVNPQEPAEAPDLGPLGAFSIGIGGIVGGGIFATLGIAVAEARGSAYLSFLVGGLVALLTAYSYTRLSIAFPSRGGTIEFLNRAFGRGFISSSLSTLLVLSYVVALSLYATAFATYAAALLPAPIQSYAVGILILLAVLNLIGPALIERLGALLNVLKLAILGGFIFLGLGRGGIAVERLGPSEWVAPVNIFATGMLVFLSFEGFELIANASPRVKNPSRALPFAYYGSIGLAMAIYASIVIVAIGHLPFDQLVRDQSYALSSVAQSFMGRIGFSVMACGAVIAASSAINSDYFGSSKLVIMLAQEGPKGWQRAREVWGHDPRGVGLLMILAVLVLTTMNLHALSAASSAGFLLIFAAVNGANVRLQRETGSMGWLSGLGVMACLAALGAMVVSLAGQRAHRHEALIIAGMALLPLLYRALMTALAARRERKGGPGAARLQRSS